MLPTFILTFAVAALLGLFSLAMLSYGYNIFKSVLPFFAFFYGAVITTSGMYALFGSGFVGGVISFIPAVIVGLIFAVLSSGLYEVFIVLIGASFGWSLVAYVFTLIGLEPNFWIYLACLLGALIFGIYVVSMQASDWVAFFITSALGATMLMTTVFLLTSKVSLMELSLDLVWSTITTSVFWLIFWFAAFIFGVVSQFSSRIYNG